MVKFLLANLEKGAWADRLFMSQVKTLNQHAASLFVAHLTSQQSLCDSLYELLSHPETSLSDKKLSMVNYLLAQGATGHIVDATFLHAARALNHEWVTALIPYLQGHGTKSRAFEILAGNESSDTCFQGSRHKLRQFLLAKGVRGRAVDDAFVASAEAVDLNEMHEYLPFVSSENIMSRAMDSLMKKPGNACTDEGLEAISILIKNGASGLPVLNAARAAAKAHKIDGVRLITGVSKDPLAYKAAFQGLMEHEEPLSSPESRTVLRYLFNREMDGEDAKSVVRLAVSAFDTDLMNSIAPSSVSEELNNFALSIVASTGTRWLSTTGLSFVHFLLDRGAKGASVLGLIETASRSRHMPALRLLQGVCDDRVQAANSAMAALLSENGSLSSAEGLSVLDMLLREGARGAVVENAAARAAEDTNFDALDVFLGSPAAASVIPAAFKAVARNNSEQLSSDQLSIASILVSHGVSTEVLAIAAVEAAKLLDLEALQVLSRSPLFPGVTDDALRALLLDQDLWRSAKGLRVLQYLLDVGVSPMSRATAASYAAAMLDIDALRIVLDVDDTSNTVNSAFTSMTELHEGWLSSEGLRIAECLLQKSPSQANMDNAFLKTCQYLHYDAMQLLYPYITDSSVFNAAFASATNDATQWFSELHLIEGLLDAGVEGNVVEAALIKSAKALDYNSLKLLASRIDRWEAFTKALAAALTNPHWRQFLDLIELLLNHHAHGDPVEEGYVSAAGSLDYAAVALLAGHIDRPGVDGRAFEAMTSNTNWLLPGHLDLLKLLFARGVTSDALEHALVSAAASLVLPAVELLATKATEKMTSIAFPYATGDGNDWTSSDGTLILSILVQKGARGNSVDQAMIESARQLRLDLVEMLQNNVDQSGPRTFVAAFDAVVTKHNSWYSYPEALDIIKILIAKDGVIPESAPSALVQAAQEGNLAAVKILSLVIADPLVYAEAFNAFVAAGPSWLEDESYGLLEHLLTRSNSHDGLQTSLTKAVEAFIVEEASIDLVTLLLKHGANVNQHDGQALQVAARYGSIETVAFLSRHNANSVTLYLGVQVALCSDHNEQVVLELIGSMVGASKVTPDVNHNSDLGFPLLFYSLKYYPMSVSLAKVICEMGADLATTINWNVYQDERNGEPLAGDVIPPLSFALLQQVSDDVIENVLLLHGG